jgi:ABC-type amino acid transport substrate-binding protein
MVSWLGGKPIRISIRATVIGFFLFATIITASVAISLQYFFSTTMATESTLSIYQSTASSTRDYLAAVDSRATAAVKILSQFTRFTNGSQISDDSRQLFAEAMQRNPLYYAIYIGFANGDFYEVVNLDADPTVRTQLRADADDRWVTIRVYGEGEKRVRRFDYYDAGFKLRASRQHKTDYDPRKRPWFIDAKVGEVHKTAPYLFQHLQAPGETYSTVVSSNKAVLALDMTLSSLSGFLSEQSLSEDSEVFLYQASGELIATNQQLRKAEPLPSLPTLNLSAEQQAQLKQIEYLTVSNEIDWPPINFAASGQPYGYAVDVFSAIAEMIGVPVRYVNGLSWNELAEMFVSNELDVLQPVFFDETRQWLGRLSEPFLTVPYGVVTASGHEPITRVEQLFDKTLAIPQGWSLATNLQENFPRINVIRVPTVRAMFDAVRDGTADAAMDIAPILNYTKAQFFIDDVTIHEPLDFGDAAMPDQLHFMINKSRLGLAEIINEALTQLGPDYHQALAEKWLQDDQRGVSHLGAVPYAELMQLAQQGGSDSLQEIRLDGRDYYVYATPFGEAGGKQDFFAIATPVDTVWRRAWKK